MMPANQMIRDHIAANLGIDLDDFNYAHSPRAAASVACISFSARSCRM